MTNVLEQLVQQVAYMFYQKEKTMVLIGLLELGRQVNIDELSEILKFKKTELMKVLGSLRQDRLIRIDQIEDLEGVEDYESLTKAQKNKLLKDYYSIDFKSFVDSVNLKIRIARERLKKQCGPEDNIFYRCPQCQATYSLIDVTSMTDTDEGLKCPNCNVILEELNDSDEKNRLRKMYEDFVQMTNPLLDLINKTDGLVMINDPEELCKSDKLIPIQEYNEVKAKLEKEIQIRKYTSHRSSGPSYQAGPGKREEVVINVNTGQSNIPSKKEDEELDKIAKYVEKQAKTQEKPKEEEKKTKTIFLFGREYTADEIDDEIMERVGNECPERYAEVESFAEGN